MEKVILLNLIKEKNTQREISKILEMSQTNVRYWLKKYNLKTLNEKGRKRFKPHLCKKCGEDNPLNFYGNDKDVCSKCHNLRVQKSAKEKRDYIINKLGGKCANVECGFNKYKSSLDVHHLNPEIKDKNFTHMRGWSIKRIDNELKKCVLLCKNCHSAYHSGELIIKFNKGQ